MTKEEAKKILTECVKACRENDMLTLEQFTYEEVIEAMDIGAKAISVLPVSSGLEEASEEWAKENYGVNYMDFDFTQDAAFRAMYHFKAGAKWYAEHAPLPDESDILRVGIKEGKRLMMEKAVEAVVQKTYKYGSTMEIVTEVPKEGGFKNGDKIRVIIAKEDNHE